MESRESNLQVLLISKLAQFNSQLGGSWGANLDWFTIPKQQSFLCSKVWGHITKAW